MSQPSSPFTPSSAPSSAASSPLPYPSAAAAGLGRAQLGEGGLTGSGEVVLGMEALAVGSQPDRGMSEEEKEKFVVNVMQELQKRRMVMEAIEWLRANYRVGTNGFTSKRDVFNHFMRVCKNKGVEPKISHTFFGKIVKRAFPNIKYNRKGPRGATQQCYTFLQRMTTDSDAASENINVSCMEEDESVLITSNPLLPRGAAEEQERKEEYDYSSSLASSSSSASASSMAIEMSHGNHPDHSFSSAHRGHGRAHSPPHPQPGMHSSLGSSSSSLSTSPTSTASSPFTIPPGMQFAAAPPGAGQATLSAPISGSPGSSYVIFSLPQVAAPCPCSHCTNATALTSFSIPSISSSSLPPQIHSLPSISTLPSIPTLPSLLIQAAPGGGFQQTTTTATATTNSPTATTTTTTMSSSPSHQPLPGSTSTSTSPTKSVEETGSF